ncbi:MAG: alpha/beta fold hydrolase [Saprospiraceae bacterium]|nr:alpha/beta fold hydrolase [Saprospiraceae bacterium]
MFKLDTPLEITMNNYTDENSKFVTIDKMSIHYKEEGEGKVLVLLHDAGTSLKIWDEWMPLLTPHFKVIRLDLPGFGLSRKSKKFDYKMDSYIYFIKIHGSDGFRFGVVSYWRCWSWWSFGLAI